MTVSAELQPVCRVPIGELKRLLGGKPVLLAFDHRSKIPNMPSVEQCVCDDVDRLMSGNIAVLLGPRSGNLISIDLDTDEVAEQFIQLNSESAEKR